MVMRRSEGRTLTSKQQRDMKADLWGPCYLFVTFIFGPAQCARLLPLCFPASCHEPDGCVDHPSLLMMGPLLAGGGITGQVEAPLPVSLCLWSSFYNPLHKELQEGSK